jgi:pimeloyl-ACP methyl ester carboxylesterase
VTDAILLPGFQEVSAEVRGLRLRAYAGGPEGGEPLVLVHGLGGAAVNWTLLAPELARQRRVLAVDLPGHGGSDRLPSAPSLAPYADLVGDLVEREGLAGADFVGHSLGGLISLRLAQRRPELVQSVVLAAAAGISSTTIWAERALTFFGWLQPGRKISPHRGTIARSRTLRQAAFGYWGAADPAALSVRAVEGLLSDVGLHTDTDSAWRALTRDDPRRDLHEVRCPCLVLWGARDNQLPIEDAFDYARRLGAPLRVIADTGHLLIVERPDACLDAIERFLSSR